MIAIPPYTTKTDEEPMWTQEKDGERIERLEQEVSCFSIW